MKLENHRKPDGTIDLVSAWEKEHRGRVVDKVGISFLALMQAYHPIRSRQVAALAPRFAWYPVTVGDQWVWLEKVQRRQTIFGREEWSFPVWTDPSERGKGEDK